MVKLPLREKGTTKIKTPISIDINPSREETRVKRKDRKAETRQVEKKKQKRCRNRERGNEKVAERQRGYNGGGVENKSRVGGEKGNKIGTIVRYKKQDKEEGRKEIQIISFQSCTAPPRGARCWETFLVTVVGQFVKPTHPLPKESVR